MNSPLDTYSVIPMNQKLNGLIATLSDNYTTKRFINNSHSKHDLLVQYNLKPMERVRDNLLYMTPNYPSATSLLKVVHGGQSASRG